MQFERIYALWLFILLIPTIIVILLAVLFFKKFETIKGIEDFLVYSKVPSWRRRYLVYFLYLSSLSLLILGLAEPFVLISKQDTQYSNIRFIFVVDVSRSMVYAEDVLPNRLVATKKQIKDFYNSLDGIYECSILPFAGDVNPYFCPFTTTKLSFLGTLEEMDWRSAPTLGTDLTRAMEAIEEIYVKKDKIDKSGLNIVILLSDGGKEEAMATNRIKLLQSTRVLANKNFKIYTVGVGGEKAAPLVVRDNKGGFLNYIVDANKQIATSQLDEEILKQISENGKGKYYNLNSSTNLIYDLQNVIKENRKLVSDKIKLEKLHLRKYLFVVTVCLLITCLMLNKV